MEFPTFEECEAAIKEGTSTPLHRFIFDNEPASSYEKAEFHKELEDLIEFVQFRVEG